MAEDKIVIDSDSNPLRGFQDVANGFARAVNTVWTGASNLIRDAYRVNVTLWDGKIEDAGKDPSEDTIYLTEQDDLLSINTDRDSSPVRHPVVNDTSLIRYCEHYNNPKDYSGLVALGVFSVIGGIFYLPWRLLKDSVISASLQVKIGINDAFLSTESAFKTNDQRSTPAKVAGVFGLVVGVALQTTIYAVAILGFSPYGYHHLARAVRQSLALLFGIDNKKEIKDHNIALYDDTFSGIYRPSELDPSLMTIFLCEFNLAKLSTLLIYGLAGVFAGVFGSKQAWDEIYRWIQDSENALFIDAKPVGPDAYLNDSEWEQDDLKFASRFGLLPWVIGGTMVCTLVLTKMINLSFRFFIGSDYTWQCLKATLKLAMNFVFETKFDVDAEERKIHKHQTDTLRGKTDRVGVLMRFLQVATVGIATVFSLVLGSAQAWRQARYWISGALFDRVPPEIKSQLNSKVPNSWEIFFGTKSGRRLETVARFGLLPWLVSGVFYLGFTVVGMIAFTFQMIWKLTLGNAIPGAGGYDGYFNRIYYRFKSDSLEGLSESEQIQQKFSELLRALPPSGKVPGLMSKDKIPEETYTLIANAKQPGFGRWILNGFLYDVRKACSLGANTLTEKVIIEFAKEFREYAETKQRLGQGYEAISILFFTPERKNRVRETILYRENGDFYKEDEKSLIPVVKKVNDPNYYEVDKIATFISTIMSSSKSRPINVVPADKRVESDKEILLIPLKNS